MYQKYNGLIYKMAKGAANRLPSTSLLEMDDLLQEGRMVCESCRKSFDPDRGCKFSTYLYHALVYMYNNIVRKEHRQCRSGADFLNVEVSSNATNQEDQLMVFEAIQALSETSKEFAQMMVDGMPLDLFLQFKESFIIRQRRGKSPIYIGRVDIKRTILQKYFKINLKKLAVVVYNIIEKTKKDVCGRW